jgi:putative transposase
MQTPTAMSAFFIPNLKPRPVDVVIASVLALPVIIYPCQNPYPLSPQLIRKLNMSRFQRASHVVWHCQYHIVWTPKCRFRILKGNVGKEVYRQIWILSEQLKIQIVELNVQIDHVHLLVKIPPKLSVSEVMGHLKGRTAIRLFSKFPYLRKHKLWGNHFWAKSYCVDTVGVNSEMIRKYVKYQEKHEVEDKQLSLHEV